MPRLHPAATRSVQQQRLRLPVCQRPGRRPVLQQLRGRPAWRQRATGGDGQLQRRERVSLLDLLGMAISDKPLCRYPSSTSSGRTSATSGSDSTTTSATTTGSSDDSSDDAAATGFADPTGSDAAEASDASETGNAASGLAPAGGLLAAIFGLALI